MGVRRQNLSAVEIVDEIISSAINKSASDIHIESNENCLRIRYRLDGILYDQEPISSELMQNVIVRIKILANIDIAKKRIPQDGKIKIKHQNKLIDLRISTFPAVNGEKIVIRILDRTVMKISLENLGFSDLMLEKFIELLNKSQGFILVTGPTGSGKTTTLYASLSYLHSPEKNIITLEDPVEYHIDGITQGHIHLESGFTFAQGIRSLLRQDPDIAMIGEIRDKESAKIAIEAALTGHLVLSTLHTNNSPSTIIRLMDMGIDPFLINAAVTGIVAQRLARKICNNCKIQISPTLEEKQILDSLSIDLEYLYKGEGCESCNMLGYKGRIGIFELLIINDALQSLIVESPRFDEIYKKSVESGMISLQSDASSKIKDGLITLDELLKLIA